MPTSTGTIAVDSFDPAASASRCGAGSDRESRNQEVAISEAVSGKGVNCLLPCPNASPRLGSRTMHQRMFAALIITFGCLWHGRATAETIFSLGQLAPACEQLESEWRAHPGDLTSPQAGGCFGYIVAVYQLGLVMSRDSNPADCSNGWTSSCRPALNFCLPREGRVGPNQLLAVFLEYARSHPAQWQEPASLHFLSAMAKAFPCPH